MYDPYRNAAFDPQEAYNHLSEAVYAMKREQAEAKDQARYKAERLKDYDQTGVVVVVAIQVCFLIAVGIFCFAKAVDHGWVGRYVRALPYVFGDLTILWAIRGAILSRWWR